MHGILIQKIMFDLRMLDSNIICTIFCAETVGNLVVVFAASMEQTHAQQQCGELQYLHDTTIND